MKILDICLYLFLIFIFLPFVFAITPEMFIVINVTRKRIAHWIKRHIYDGLKIPK